nr:EOG090X01W2 [Eulimnadia texana]
MCGQLFLSARISIQSAVMSSPGSSSLDSAGTSPLGSLSDPLEHPLLALDLGLGPLVGYGDNRQNSSTFSCSSIINSLYLNGIGSSIFDSSSSMKVDCLTGGSSRPPSGGVIGCTSSGSSSSSGVSSPGLATKCAVCGIGDSYSILPKVLPCLHALCQQCWDKQQTDSLDKHGCPVCQTDCLLSDVESLLCTSCKSKDVAPAVARCFDCATLLCPSCVLAHQLMNCFDGHRVVELCAATSSLNQHVCQRHRGEVLNLYCHSCASAVCPQCLLVEHNGPGHDLESLSDATPRLVHQLGRSLNDARARAGELRAIVQSSEATVNKLSGQLSKAQSEVNETFQFYRAALEERREELLRELEAHFSGKQSQLNDVGHKTQQVVERITRTCSVVERFAKRASPLETLLFKKLLDSKMAAIQNFCPPEPRNMPDIEFISNFKAIQIGVRNTYGYIRSADEGPNTLNRQPPIARPLVSAQHSSNNINNSNNSISNSMSNTFSSINYAGIPLSASSDRISPGSSSSSSSGLVNTLESHLLTNRFQTKAPVNSFALGLNDLAVQPYDKWSTTTSSTFEAFPNVAGGDSSGLLDLSKLMTSSAAPMYPIRSQIKRHKMIYHCKFGEFGVMEGQFTEPSGVAVNAQGEIIVADTNNHRIQIFDKDGRFKFQFGECGKRDGQLLYPNRVAVVKTSGDIVVTERSPTHQIQIYNQYGQFVRKFGANVLQHPRGVTVDNKGRIIVVECKVMRVIIFDQLGNVLHKFGCSKHLEFPNGVVVNDKQEIFISDNRAHCVKVFNYDGVFLRQIGGEGLTNYPIGVGINAAGEILIADNHNNFNLTIFTQDGQLVSALESKVKHAQCFDVALLDDGSVVLASKDYRLFGHDWDPTCMKMDEVLYHIAEKVKNFAVIYLVDITEVPDFNKMYELYDPCTVMFFFRNRHMMIDLGTGNNNKINWAIENKQEMIDILETVYRGARKGRGLVISPKDYSTKYRY